MPPTYEQWQERSVTVGGIVLRVATKPGVPGFERPDPAALMLAEAMAGIGARVGGASDGARVTVHLHCGDGLAPAAAAIAGGATAVWCADRALPSVRATERTLAVYGAHGADGARALHAHGTHAFPPDLRADVVTVRITPDKQALQQLVLDAFRVLRIGGTCFLAGANDEGAKPAVRLVETVFGAARLAAQHSGHRMAVAVKAADVPTAMPAEPSPYLDATHFRDVPVTLHGRPLTLFSRPGVFSWTHLDEATQLLGDLLDVRSGESVLDLGCGAGALGLTAATLSGTGRVLLLDADAEAVRCAARGIAHAGLANAEVRASDVGDAAGDERFDVVVSNPPFHVGKATDLHVPRRFIADAHRLLRPGGRLLLVANRTLPYEREIADRFGDVRTLHDGRRFKVLGATR